MGMDKWRHGKSDTLWFWACAGFVILCGAAIRVLTISDHLPFIFDSDEPANIEVVQNMLRTGTGDPTAFSYPPFFYYLLIPSQIVVQVISGELLPFVMQSMGNGHTSQPEAFLAARSTTLALGVGIIISTMLVARELRQKEWSILVVGVLTAFNPLLVAYSRVSTPDTPAALFATLALLGAIRVQKSGSTPSYIFAGIMSGLAASSKYNAGLVAISIITSHLMIYRLDSSRLYLLILAGFISMITLILSSPFLILDFRNAIGGILFEIRHYRVGHPGAEGDTFVTNLTWIWNAFGACVLLAPLSILSVETRRLVLPVAVFAVAYFLLISIQFVRFERNLLPMIPAVIVLVGAALVPIHSILSAKVGKVGFPAAALIVVISLMPSLHRTVLETSQRYSDPRKAVRSWIGEHIASGASIMLDSYSPFVDPKLYTATGVLFVLEESITSIASTDVVVISRNGSGRFLHDINSKENETFKKMSVLACQRMEFKSSDVTAFWVFIFRCSFLRSTDTLRF
jgi:4-amino-4-deoxy-L-arabinose transferase-like glycosyltransferase